MPSCARSIKAALTIFPALPRQRDSCPRQGQLLLSCREGVLRQKIWRNPITGLELDRNVYYRRPGFDTVGCIQRQFPGLATGVIVHVTERVAGQYLETNSTGAEQERDP